MLKRIIVCLLTVSVLGLAAGCGMDFLGDSASRAFPEDGRYIVVAEGAGDGWVEVDVAVGGTIHWGDSFEPESFVNVSRGGTYGHYYERPGVYVIQLLTGDLPLDMTYVAVKHVAGHLELIRVDGSTVVVEWFGCGGLNEYYWIIWGDTNMTTVAHNEDRTWTTQREHTYAEPGTYEIGIRGDINGGDAYRAAFSVTIH